MTRPMNMQPIQFGLELSWMNIPDTEPFVCQFQVSKEQLSQTIEHVSNIEYVRWLDRVAELHADSLGYTRARLLTQGMMWFVARHEIDYLAEAWLNDSILIATWVREVAKVKSWRDTVVVRRSDEVVICRASTLWVLVELSTRKPLRMSEEMVSLFKPLVLPAGRHGLGSQSAS
jgi:acyl-CoA thioester hydrolase